MILKEVKSFKYHIFMRSFEDLVRTTRTVIADTNLTLDIAKVYELIPITECVVAEKKKGRRKKKDCADPVMPTVLPSGSIVSAKYNGQSKGLVSKSGKAAFKNSITIVMDIKQRRVNFKLSKNGRFQITGNNDNYHIEKCVKYMWKLLRTWPEVYEVNGTSLKVTFWSSMVNFKTNVGFRISRQNLNTYINEMTEYVSIFETSSGSASVNIKMPLVFEDLELQTMTYRSNKWVRGTVMYNDFARNASGKITNKDKRYVSFLVFHTGEIIMTAMDREVMQPYFHKFMELLDNFHAHEL